MMSNCFIFNTRIDNLAQESVTRQVDAFLTGEHFHQIATINPEFLLLSQADALFRDVLNTCDLNVVDGFGLHFALWCQGKKLRARMPGADLMMYILRQAEQRNLSVLCVVRKDGLSAWKDIRRSLKKQYPMLHVDGIDIKHTMVIGMLRAETHQRIKSAHIILCNFGAPSQEVFLAGLRNGQGAIHVAMGVGGSFDFMTGKLKRAPHWMRVVGLEWLWRLLKQPSRFRRIWRAVVIFPVQVVKAYLQYHKT